MENEFNKDSFDEVGARVEITKNVLRNVHSIGKIETAKGAMLGVAFILGAVITDTWFSKK